MENVYYIARLLTSDQLWFTILQAVILITLIFTGWIDLTRGKSAIVTRGKESRDSFAVWAGAIITLLISAVFQITSFPAKHKVFFYLFDLIAITYLCFYSSWFTNFLVSLKINFEKREY